tara:strand:- start:9606 stop:10808 length:1203 start_codon:yes stop_codon:yes gene_type:complete
MYNKIVIFSGPYSIDALGATKTIDIGLAKSLVKTGYDVTLIAFGECSIPNINHIKINITNKLSLIYRALSKIGFKGYLQLKRNRKVDLWVAKYLIDNSDILDKNSVFIGRAGMSLHSFMEAKNQHALTVLHSSWMHPYTQRDILQKEYNVLKIKSRAIPKKRIKIQLKEIDIVNRIWGISTLVYNSYLNNGVAKNKLFNISLGVDFEHYTISGIEEKIYAERESSFKILFVGQVNYEKGAHLLLEALKKSTLSNLEMIFNGSLPNNFNQNFYQYKEELEKRNIKVTLSPGDPIKNYKQASIFVLPSIHESFGLVVLEAMASGLPTIISDSVGAKDCVVNEKTGFVFESHNVKELMGRIEYIFYNRSVIKILGKNSANIASDYDWDKVVFRFKEYLNNIKN